MLSVMVENAVWLRRSPGVMLVGLQLGTVSLNSCPGTSAKRADSNANTHCKKKYENLSCLIHLFVWARMQY